MILVDQFYRMAIVGLVFVNLLLLMLKVTPGKMVFTSIIYIYVAFVLGIVLFPLPYSAAPSLYPAANNFVPFASVWALLRRGGTENILIQLGGNIALFVPYGAILFYKKKKGLALLFWLLLFPVGVEILQFVMGQIIGVNYRSVDVDDVLLNLAGGATGYYLSTVVIFCVKRALKKSDKL